MDTKIHTNKKQLRLFYISIMIIILLGFGMFATIKAINIIREDKLNTEWGYILTVLEENQSKANNQAEMIKDNIINEINMNYNNKEQLQLDLDTINDNSKISKILNDKINGKFINVDNDNNDIFVLSRWNNNIIYDKSINCSVKDNTKKTKSISDTLSMSYNYDLGYDAFLRILNQDNNGLTFMEYLTNNDPNHKIIKYCSIDQLKEVYIEEGISGLKSYEILNPVYINNREDLLGNNTVLSSGKLNESNRQLILVQGFSLYDAIYNENYISRLNDITNRFDSLEQMLQFGAVTFSIIFIIIIINLSKIQNLATEIEDLQLKINKE